MMSRKPTGSSRRHAFTLLELLLVLVLIAVSAATVVPHLNGTLGRWQLRETTHNLQAALQMASQWSGVRHEAVVFSLDMRGNGFSLRPLAAGRPATRGLPAVGRQSFGQGVAILRTEGFADVGNERILVFRPDGTSNAAAIVLTGSKADSNRETSWQVIVDGYGAVRCEEKLTDEADR